MAQGGVRPPGTERGRELQRIRERIREHAPVIYPDIVLLLRIADEYRAHYAALRAPHEPALLARAEDLTRQAKRQADHCKELRECE